MAFRLHTLSSHTRILRSRQRKTIQSSSIHQRSCVTGIKYFGTNAGAPNTPSLYGVRFLKEPRDFLKAAQVAVDVCNPLIQSIVGIPPSSSGSTGGKVDGTVPQPLTPSSGLSTLHKLDTISDTICKVLDAAECTRNLHAKREWRDAAERTFHALSAYMYQLNAFTELHDALRQVTDNEAVMKAMNEEQRRMALLLRREFERDGIHLPQEERASIVQLNSEIGQVASQFLRQMQGGGGGSEGGKESSSSSQSANEVLIENVPGAAAIIQALPSHVRAMLPPQQTNNNNNNNSVINTGGGGLEFGGIGLMSSEDSSGNGSSSSSSSSASSLSPSSSTAVLTTDPGVVGFILREVAEARIRKPLMIASHTSHAENVKLLEQLRADRHRLARGIGFPSYAHMMVSDRMAGDPMNAVVFLQTLSKAIMPRAAADLAALVATKEKHMKMNSSNNSSTITSTTASNNRKGTSAAATASSTSTAPFLTTPTTVPAARVIYEKICRTTPVEAWDIPYYAAKTTAEKYGVDAAAAAEYFPLSAVLHGLQTIMSKVFGVTMVGLPVEEGGEAWDSVNSSSSSSSSSSPSSSSSSSLSSSASQHLLKFVLRHDVEGALGTLYLDLFSRPGKFGGAAHFVVRCGKRLHEMDGGFEKAMSVEPQVASVGGTQGQSFQLPIIVLATNYAPPPSMHRKGSNSNNGATNSATSWFLEPANADPLAHILMAPQEVETLFHEYGHALHSLLSRTEFQHLSGTRGALDFVEVPSHLMEYYARDYRVVRTFARHHITGVPMPEDLWNRIQSSRSAFAGLDLQSAVATALYDQALFGSEEVVKSILNGCSVALSAQQEKQQGGGNSNNNDIDVDTVIAAVETAAAKSASSRLQTAIESSSSALDGASAVSSHPRLPAGYLQEKDVLIPMAATDALRPMPNDGEPTSTTTTTTTLATTTTIDSTELLAQVHARYALSPHVPGSKWQATFAHAATYGGGYYTYIYAAVLSSALWQKLFAGDPFSRVAGETYRREILAKGSGADPVGMLTKVLGGPATMEPLLRELGLMEQPVVSSDMPLEVGEKGAKKEGGSRNEGNISV